MEETNEEEEMHSVAMQNASSVFLARQRAEHELLKAKEELEARTVVENRGRQKAEKALRVSEQRWHSLFEHATVGIDLLDVDGHFFAANPAFQHMVGYSQDELLQLTIGDITVEEDRHLNSEIMEAYRRGAQHSGRIEKRYRRKDGAVVWAEVSTFVVPRDAGGPMLFAGVVVDITERKRAEQALRLAQAELAHVSRVTVMGEIAASIAHEVNQPLAASVMSGSAGLRWLEADPPNVEEARAAMRRVISDGNRASDVLSRIRGLLRKGSEEKSALSVNDVVRETLAITSHELERHRIEVRTELLDGVPHVMGDRVQLQQVVLNLILNAIDAMAGADRVRALSIRSHLDDSKGIVLEVTDCGRGFEPGSQDRIFDAFFSTKPTGLGMGLSVSRSIVEAHGGTLRSVANAGPGATFYLTLPGAFSSA
jgi:PAS domain S-box-containing protein